MSTFSSHKQQQQQQQQQQSVFPFETNYLPPSEFVVPKNFPQFYSSSFIHNETCLTEKQSIHCSSMAVETESGTHHVTQNGVVSSHNKRKSKHGSSSSSLNSTLSKGGNKQQVKTKKQKGEKEATIMKKEEKKDKDGEEEAPKGYIHVRARRGQATDSHSLAERVRREKISKKMGTLQALVPGCDKVTGKAFMLDEIINYVQSLQNQVEFLSMKLASVDPMVYTFGLMDHDSILFRSTLQGLSNKMALPNNRLIESTGGNTSGSTSPSQAFGTANSCLASPATSSTLSPTFPITHVDTTVYLPQAEHKPIFSPFQDAGGSYWGINEDDKQSNIVNQFGLSANNFYSLH